MCCVMFSMLEANAVELSWSTTTSVIKLGLRTLEEQSGKQLSLGQHTSVTLEDVDAVRLLMLEEPLWNGIRLDASDCRS
jgi:hypothetical protein